MKDLNAEDSKILLREVRGELNKTESSTLCKGQKTQYC